MSSLSPIATRPKAETNHQSPANIPTTESSWAYNLEKNKNGPLWGTQSLKTADSVSLSMLTDASASTKPSSFATATSSANGGTLATVMNQCTEPKALFLLLLGTSQQLFLPLQNRVTTHPLSTLGFFIQPDSWSAISDKPPQTAQFKNSQLDQLYHFGWNMSINRAQAIMIEARKEIEAAKNKK